MIGWILAYWLGRSSRRGCRYPQPRRDLTSDDIARGRAMLILVLVCCAMILISLH